MYCKKTSLKQFCFLMTICLTFLSCQPASDQRSTEIAAEQPSTGTSAGTVSEIDNTQNENPPSSEDPAPFSSESEPEVRSFSVHDQFEGADPEVKIFVDAQGTYVTEDLPVLRVSPKMISMDEIRRWAEVFSTDGTVYEPRRRSEDPELTVLTDWAFHETGYYPNAGFAEGPVDVDDNFVADLPSALGTGRLSVYNLRAGSFYRVLLNFSIYSELSAKGGYPRWNTALEHPATIAPEEAREKAETLLQKMEITGFVCTGIGMQGAADGYKRKTADGSEEPVYRYNVRFRRQCGPVTVFPSSIMGDPKAISCGVKYDNEELNVLVVNDEIFSLTWSSPLEVVGVEDNAADSVPFEKAYAACRKQMQAEYTLGKMTRLDPQSTGYKDELEKMAGAEIRINDISFGMARLQIPDNNREFLFVPAWRFAGAELQDFGSGCDWNAGYEQRFVYQIINALDGTPISLFYGESNRNGKIKKVINFHVTETFSPF